MSIETNLYNFFYDKFEGLNTKVKRLREERDLKGIDKIEARFKRDDKTMKYIEIGCWLGTSLGLFGLANDVTSANSSDIGLKVGTTLSVMTPFLATHFHQSRKMEGMLLDKLLGKNLEDLEPRKVRRSQNIGRYSHLAGVTTLLTFVGQAGYELAKEHPLLASALGGIGGFCYYHNFIEGYRALYTSMGDFILGERRHQNKPEGSSK